MATITKGKTFTETEQVTHTKLHTLVDSATIAGIEQADIVAGSGLVITSTSTPADTNALWIDSANGYILKKYNGSSWVTSGLIPAIAEPSDTTSLWLDTLNGNTLMYYNSDDEEWQAVSVPTPDEDLMQIGMIYFTSTSTVPTGYLECDGSAISRTTYADLFSVISTNYGVGNGSTTFNIPDLRGRFPRIWAHGSTNDPDRASRTNRGDGVTGDYVGTKQADAFKSHTHPIYIYGDDSSGNYAGRSNGMDYAFAVNTGDTGGNETRPININLMAVIKY